MVGNKIRTGIWDYGTLALYLVLLCPACFLYWKLWCATEEIKKKAEAGKHRGGERKGGSIQQRLRKLQFKEGAFKYLLLLEPMELVLATGTVMLARYMLDTVSWLYFVATGGMWDWFVAVTDGIAVFLGTFGSVLLVFVFIQRCYRTFDGTPFQHSQQKYALVCGLSLLAGVCSIFMGAMSIGLKWKLLGISSIIFIILLISTSSLTIWFFVGPLLQLARTNENAAAKTLHLSARITLVSFIALLSTCVAYTLAAIGYTGHYAESIAVYLYFSWVAVDTCLNLLCLLWSLKTGQKVYYKWCRCAHRSLVNAIDIRDSQFRTPMPWMASDKSFGSTKSADTGSRVASPASPTSVSPPPSQAHLAFPGTDAAKNITAVSLSPTTATTDIPQP